MSLKKFFPFVYFFVFDFVSLSSSSQSLSLITMPELPEVEAARQTAEEYLVNKTIVQANAVEDESEFFFFFLA